MTALPRKSDNDRSHGHFPAGLWRWQGTNVTPLRPTRNYELCESVTHKVVRRA